MSVAATDELISFSSEIKELSALRSELCRIPRKYTGSGRLQLVSKPDMQKLGISSPNMADAVMMGMRPVQVSRKREPIKYPSTGINKRSRAA
jgi:phage terminase large subunit